MSKMDLIDNEEERQFYKDMHEILEHAQNIAYAAVNDIMSYAYWNIRERIVEQEQKGVSKAKYGSYLIKRLAQELSGEFASGFSVATIVLAYKKY